MELQAIDGFGDVDATAVLKEKTLETLKRLPEGDVVALISQLPENVVREICKRGVSEEVMLYLPTFLALGITGTVTYIVTGSLWGAIAMGVGSGLVAYLSSNA